MLGMGVRDLVRVTCSVTGARQASGQESIKHWGSFLLILWVAVVEGGGYHQEELVGARGKLSVKELCEILHLQAGFGLG